MIDGIIKDNGTSRLMRATLPATYEEFRAAVAAGTQALDILFNAAGWSQLPDFLNKANLLQDATALAYGLTSAAVPDDVLNVLSKALMTKKVPYLTKHTVTLADAAQNDVVYIKEGGSMVPYIVVYHGNPDTAIYDASCTGTWLMRKELWHLIGSSVKTRNFVGSEEETLLNGTFLESLPAAVQAKVKEVKIPYTVVDTSAATTTKYLGENGHALKVFLPAYNEVYDSTPSRDGAYLGGFNGNSTRIAKYGTTAYPYATRTAVYSSDSDGRGLRRYIVDSDGSMESTPSYSGSDVYLRPMMILDDTLELTWYTDGVGNVFEDQDYRFMIAYPNGEQASAAPIAQIEIGQYTGTGTYASGYPNALAFPFAPKIVIIRSDSGRYNMVLTCNSAKAYGDSQSTWGSNNVTWADGGKSVSWYVVAGGGSLGSVTIDAAMQCNAADDTYTYIAIA